MWGVRTSSCFTSCLSQTPGHLNAFWSFSLNYYGHYELKKSVHSSFLHVLCAAGIDRRLWSTPRNKSTFTGENVFVIIKLLFVAKFSKVSEHIPVEDKVRIRIKQNLLFKYFTKRSWTSNMSVSVCFKVKFLTMIRMCSNVLSLGLSSKLTLETRVRTLIGPVYTESIYFQFHFPSIHEWLWFKTILTQNLDPTLTQAHCGGCFHKKLFWTNYAKKKCDYAL